MGKGGLDGAWSTPASTAAAFLTRCLPHMMESSLIKERDFREFNCPEAKAPQPILVYFLRQPLSIQEKNHLLLSRPQATHQPLSLPMALYPRTGPRRLLEGD